MVLNQSIHHTILIALKFEILASDGLSELSGLGEGKNTRLIAFVFYSQAALRISSICSVARITANDLTPVSSRSF